ncbi:MAG: flagellin FliC [Planctomycetes bacterium]|nr:flagellin FliC [Planctomycetota bacterium]
MALTINTSIEQSMQSLMERQVASQARLQATMSRLSSGLRINSAADDSAGLSISTRMSAQIRGLDQAARGIEQGMGMVQTADGGLSEITTALMRQRELAVQAANGSLSADQFQGLDKEMKDLGSEIDRIAATTTFDGTNLLDGSLKDYQIPVSAFGQKASITISSADSGDPAGFDSAGLGLSGITLDSSQAGTDAVKTLDAAIATVDKQRNALGTLQNKVFATGMDSLMSMSTNLTAARSRIMDTDFASETAGLTRGQILQQTGTAMLAQANQSSQAVLSLLR